MLRWRSYRWRGWPEGASRVLRGGAFNNNDRNARCAYRNRNNPHNGWNNNGFRVAVVASHASPDEGNQASPVLSRPEMLFIYG